jgi:hypothetical protein
VKPFLAAVLPSRALTALLGGAGATLIALRFSTLTPAAIALVAAGLGVGLLALLAVDARLSWMSWVRAPLTLTRRLPHAFAVGAPVSRFPRCRCASPWGRVSARPSSSA